MRTEQKPILTGEDVRRWFEQGKDVAGTLEKIQWERRTKIWNRLMGWGLFGVASGVGLLALSIATLGTAPGFALSSFVIAANIVAVLGGGSFVTGLGARIFDRSPKNR